LEDISTLIQKLEWGTPVEEKENAIKKLQFINDDELHLLLQPLTKAHWDGAAEVIINLGYPRVKSILPGLLIWIQDLNWPGASQISVFLREIGDPIIPYIKDVFIKHSDDEGWIGWIFELIVDQWNTKQISHIQKELIQLSKGRVNDLKSLRILLVHRICPKESINIMIQEKREEIISEIIELEKLSPGIDCEELEREFNEVIFKPELSRPYYERNKARFSFCNYKSYLQNYLSEIEGLASEVSYFA
jgi:hypothetical protein